MIRDRLVCGVSHDTIQPRLLAEKDLTYEKAIEIAQAVEAAEKNTKIIKNGNGKQSIHYAGTATSKQADKKVPVKRSSQEQNRDPITCYRCGGPHLAPVCKYKDAVCRTCQKKGHLAKVCRSKGKPPGKPVTSQRNYYVQDSPEDEDTSEGSYGMFIVQQDMVKPYILDVHINQVPIKMEFDTGASLSILSAATYHSIKEKTNIPPLEESHIRLKTYTGEVIKVLGKTTVSAKLSDQEEVLTIHVVDGAGPDLLGRDWVNSFKVNPGKVNHIEENTQPLQNVLDKHAEVFDGTLGCLKDVEISLEVKPQSRPKFFKPHSVPFAFKKIVKEELDRLMNQGIISPVKTSKWAAPIVPVLKRNGTMRICGDFKTTFNQVSDTESYPLPRVDELFSNLAGGKYFSTLDLSNAYLQLPLAESSKEFLTINTHQGLYQFNRLPFGVASAPAIFQRTMETLLRDLPGVAVYLDDILIMGRCLDEHLQNLDRVLERLAAAGLRLNRDKCSFLQTLIEYLGHVIDAQGLHPTEEKISAIKNAPTPKNITELRSFLGMLNYYSKFMPGLSMKLAPLYTLLRKESRWIWGSQQERAFAEAKNALQADSVLVHFDPAKPLILACDASDYGLGAVLSHQDDNGERPIAYISRTLNPAEKKYSQLEKEALAIIFAVKKFHQYLYGVHFTIQSDHQPLSFLFSERKGIPVMASSRIQRWAVTLAAYRYNIQYKPGKKLNNADALSRLPLAVTTKHDGLPGDVVHIIDHLSTTTCSSASIQKWTERDPVLSEVKRFVLQGFPSQLDSKFTPFKSRSKELSVTNGCILWGARVVVPPQGRSSVLKELHDTHPGCSKMKSLARSYIWWPKMDSDIEDFVKQCQSCQESRPAPPVAPLHPWEWPSVPWSRLHLDFAGPFLGHNFLVLVDACSKWMDVQLMNSTASVKTIEVLRKIFSTHGLPRKIVTDNGTAFTSHEFRTFMEQNGIRHVTSAPYHPSTNGLAERAVQTFKRAIERMGDRPIQERLSKFLLMYRLTPHSTTGIAPAEMLLGRRPRSVLDNLHPDPSDRVEHKQLKQKLSHDTSKLLRSFKVGQSVLAENFTGKNPKWMPGTISDVTGPLSYKVSLSGGITVRRHIDSIRDRQFTVDNDRPLVPTPLMFPSTATVSTPSPRQPPPPPQPPELRRSTRARTQFIPFSS